MPEVTFLPFGCPVCRAQVPLAQTFDHQSIFKCQHCQTTVSVPKDAWLRTTMRKNQK